MAGDRLRVKGHALAYAHGVVPSWAGACECGEQFRGVTRADITAAHQAHKKAAAEGGATDGDA